MGLYFVGLQPKIRRLYIALVSRDRYNCMVKMMFYKIIYLENRFSICIAIRPTTTRRYTTLNLLILHGEILKSKFKTNEKKKKNFSTLLCGVSTCARNEKLRTEIKLMVAQGKVKNMSILHVCRTWHKTTTIISALLSPVL